VTDTMNTAFEQLDLKHDAVQMIVREAVSVALQSPLREPILEAVEAAEPSVDAAEAEAADRSAEAADTPSGDEDEPGGTATSSTAKTGQGVAAFVATVAVLYVLLRRVAGEEPAE
jgi:hypothetical protein